MFKRNKLGQFVKGCKMPQSYINKIQKANKGKKKPPRTEQHKKNLSKAAKGQHHSIKTEFKKGFIPWNKDTKGLMAIPWNKNIKFSQITGKNHWNWKNGISTKQEKIRHSLKMKQWDRSIFQNDNRTCQKCKKKSKLTGHHIKNFAEFPELRFETSNGITFCYKCHKLFHQTFGYKNNNKEQLKEFLT